MAYQSPSRHSFPSTQRYFLDKKPPEWFKGDSTGWIDESTGKPGPERKLASSGEEKENKKEEANNVTRLSQNLSLPDMPHLKHIHGIDASTVMKAALALLNTKLTGQKIALFAEYFSARNSWPFLPEWMSSGFAAADGGRWADGAEGCCGD